MKKKGIICKLLATTYYVEHKLWVKIFYNFALFSYLSLYFRLIFHNFQELLLNFSKNSYCLCVDSTDSERCKGTILLSTM